MAKTHIPLMYEEPPRLASVGDVEAAHKHFNDLRTEASLALKALGQLEKPDIPSELPSVQEVKKKLVDLRQQKERLVVQKAEAGCHVGERTSSIEAVADGNRGIIVGCPEPEPRTRVATVI